MPCLKAHFLIVGLGVNRNVMKINMYADRTKLFKNLSMRFTDAVEAQPDYIEVKGGIGVGTLPGWGNGQIVQCLVVALSELVTSLHELVYSF